MHCSSICLSRVYDGHAFNFFHKIIIEIHIRKFQPLYCAFKNISSNQFHRSIVLPYIFTGNGQSTTPCPIWTPYDGKRNLILTSLIVVTLVLAVICIAYLVLLGFEKYLINTHREEQIYANQIIPAWFRHHRDKRNHIYK